MARGRRIAAYVGIGVAVVLLLLVVGVVMITRTDWGRERVRTVITDQLRNATDGRVEIGAVEGNLLRRIRLVDVTIADDQERPFLRADTVATRFSLGGLLRRQIVLTDVRLVRAVVVLDQPPGEEWNYVRIFRIDPDPDPVEPQRPGWGSWVSLSDVEIVDSRITILTEWKPAPELTPDERERVVREALAGETRENVVAVGGGYQNVMDFRQLDALLPRVIVAHPDSAGIPIEIARFSGIAQPFAPPAATVRDLAGKVRLEKDTLHFTDIRAAMPGSQLSAAGAYDLNSGNLDLSIRGRPLAFDDMRWLYPPLPEQGGGPMDIRVERRPLATRIVATDVDARVGAATIAGRLDLTVGDTLRLGPTDLTFARVGADLVRRFIPALDIPRPGELTGTMALRGPTQALRLDGDVRFDDAAGGGSSRVVVEGELGLQPETRFRDLRLQLLPLQASFARAFVPDLPVMGTIEGTAQLTGSTAGLLRIDSDLVARDTRTGVSRIRATGGVDLSGDMRLRGMVVRADPLRLDLLRDFVPNLPAGSVAGTMRIDGPPAGVLRLDGTLRHEGPGLGASTVTVNGGLATGDPLRFHDLRLGLEPLNVALVRAYAPDLPLGGTLSGTATLNGAPSSRIAVSGDLVHLDRGEQSRVTGQGTVAMGPGGSASVDVTLQPLSLVTAGRFAPGADLRGSVSGQLQATGPLSDLRVNTDLRVAGGGAIAGGGTLDVDAEQPAYDLDLRLTAFNIAALTGHAPSPTSLTGSVRAAGRGTEPAAMRAIIAADLQDSEVDGVGADEVRLRVELDGGLATVDSSVVRLRSAEAILDGSFGLVEGRQGELAFRVEVDSLQHLAGWLPGGAPADTAAAAEVAAVAGDTVLIEGQVAGDTARVGGQVASDTARLPAHVAADTAGVPAGVVVADAVLGADSALIAGAARDTVMVAADSVAGSIRAQGTLRGNVAAFDAAGTVEVEELVYGGTRVGRGQAEYAVVGATAETPDVTLEAGAAEVHAGGLAFDSVAVDGQYRGGRYGEGSATVAAFQDDATDYRLDAEFMLSLERSELRLADAQLRFDTVTWRTARPGLLSWGGDGIEVDSVELVSTAGGRIFADGDLPADGTADLRLAVENADLGQLITLAQSDLAASGSVNVEATVEGTRASPLIRGTATLQNATVDGNPAPDVRAEFDYAELALSAEATLEQDGRLLATAEARLPMDLALTGDVQQRLLDGEIAVDVQADSLPIEALPFLAEQVDDARGRIAGDISVRGTFESPLVEGLVNLDLGSITIVPLGVRFDRIAGTLTMDGTTVTVDSLVAYSGGSIVVDGAIDVSTLSAPVFDLTLVADNAKIIDTERARLDVDAELSIAGPLTAVEITGEAHGRSGMLRIPTLDELGSGRIVNLDDPATFELADSMFIAERDLLFPRNPALDNLHVDIGLVIDRDIWLRSPEANVEIYTPPETGPLRIVMDGADNDLTLLGTVNTDRGVYEFMGRRFNLTRGAVTFTGEPELNPFLQIAAEHEVRLPGREAFQIRVVIGGTLQDFSLTLESTSQPPISQTDLLSYLAFGRDASSLLYQQGSSLSGQSGGGAGELVGNVAGMATQQLAAVALEAIVSEIETETMRELRLDVFRITPADLPADMFTGSYADVFRGTEIEAGRYISPRLFVAAQARVGLNRPGIRMEYWTPQGYQWQASLQPRFLAREPTLGDQDIRTGNVFGTFLFRNWRF